MKYEKPPLDYLTLANQLINRGLEADKDQLIGILQNVNYYRLSTYLYPFRKDNGKSHQFIKGTTLQKVWNRYTFDRQLRFLILDGIERFEVAIRTKIVHHFVMQYGPFEYTNKEKFKYLTDEEFEKFSSKIKYEVRRSKEPFIQHFNKHYGDSHKIPPLWMACELFSLGSLLSFYRGIEKPLKQKAASELQIPDVLLLSWLERLNVVRNTCAHHARVWDRKYNVKLPTNATKYPKWFYPVKIEPGNIFCILTILKYCLNKFAPDSRWDTRLKLLLSEYPGIPPNLMGFPKNWEKSLIWSKTN